MRSTLDVAIEPYLERLRDLPFVRAARVIAVEPPGRSGLRPDATIEIETPTRSVRLPCELRRSHLGRDVAHHLVNWVHHDAAGLVVMAPRIGHDLGDLFEREGVNFVDLAGNCWLRLGDHYVARIQGRAVTAARPVDKALRPASYRALLALLIAPELLDGSTRALATAAGGLSPQTATDLRARLVERGDVLRIGRHHQWAPAGRSRAMRLWSDGFSTTLLPSLLVDRYRGPSNVEALEQTLAPRLAELGGWRWGGGAAAERLTHYYRGDRTVVYLDTAPADLAKRSRLVRDVDGPVLMVRAPGPLAFRSPHPDTVNPLLVYADLIAEGHERALAAAGELARSYLPDLDVPTP